MDLVLRQECKSLLDQLKCSQQLLKGTLPCSKELNTQLGSFLTTSHGLKTSSVLDTESSKFGKDITGNANLSAQVDETLKPSYARDKLMRSANLNGFTTSNPQLEKECMSRKFISGKENFAGSDFNKRDHVSYNKSANKITSMTLHQSRKEHSDSEEELVDRMSKLSSCETVPSIPSSRQSATPNTTRQRQLIDRHISVPTKLDAKELKDLDNERHLNFSYSHITVDDDVAHLKPTSDESLSQFKPEFGENCIQSNKTLMGKEQENFKQQLQDDGNNRKLNNFVKEATIKPKSILNSTAYYSLNSSKRNASRVRFDSTQNSEMPTQDHRLLGYDWIAALLDNDPVMMDQSESYFDELKDFRKAHKDECCNQFYMQGPHTLVDTEPEEVVEALTEPKVRPYIVNERLFTEPLRPELIEYPHGQDKQGQKEPTKDNPRFVRVSIPRSTLQTPFRVKPHRRRSFDASDTCSLMDHCLLGWENTRPEMIPAAQSLDLNTEAGTRTDSETTTLADAEQLAKNYNKTNWAFSKPTTRLQSLPNWRRQYMNTTLNMTLPGGAASLSNTRASGRSVTSSEDVKRATDRLLNATYSTMYEMERLRQERELEKRQNEKSEQ